MHGGRGQAPKGDCAGDGDLLARGEGVCQVEDAAVQHPQLGDNQSPIKFCQNLLNILDRKHWGLLEPLINHPKPTIPTNQPTNQPTNHPKSTIPKVTLDWTTDIKIAKLGDT